MKLLLIIGAALSFLAVVNLPMGYYTFLRIYLTLVSAIVVYSQYSEMDEINIWMILFGITAIIFNPIIPIYLHDASVWAVIDIIVGILFGIYAFKFNSKSLASLNIN